MRSFIRNSICRVIYDEGMRFLPALLLTVMGTALAESPVIGMNNFLHATESLQKTVAFYKEVFGLPTPPPPRPPNPAVPGLVNAPGAQFQVAVFRIPGAMFGWELTNFGPIERKAGQARPTDPGAGILILRVRDLDTVFAAIKKAGAPIVTRSGAPVKVGNGRSVMFRDPDGFLVEVDEVDENNGATMAIAVSNMTATLKFYRDLLGFELTGEMGTRHGDKARMDLIGAPASTQYRQMAGTIRARTRASSSLNSRMSTHAVPSPRSRSGLSGADLACDRPGWSAQASQGRGGESRFGRRRTGSVQPDDSQHICRRPGRVQGRALRIEVAPVTIDSSWWKPSSGPTRAWS